LVILRPRNIQKSKVAPDRNRNVFESIAFSNCGFSDPVPKTKQLELWFFRTSQKMLFALYLFYDYVVKVWDLQEITQMQPSMGFRLRVELHIV
jgi:hypothetical protein